MKTPNLEFQISQLRQDKIIYAVEAVAFNLAAIVSLTVITYLRLPEIYIVIVCLSALAYTLYMGLGNLQRLHKIKQLESLLK